MKDLTTRKKLESYHGTPDMVLDLDDEDALRYVKESYFVEAGLQFLVWFNPRGQAIVWEAIGGKDDWRDCSDWGYLLARVLRGGVG